MNIGRHSFYMLAGAAIPLCIALVTIPIYINALGQERYGVLAISWLFLGYFGAADLGLGRAITQRIAKLKPAPAQERATVFWSAMAVNVGLASFGALLFYIVARIFFISGLKVDDILRQELLASLWIIAAAVPVITVSGISMGTLAGREQFGVVSIGSIISNSLGQLLPLFIVLYYTNNLYYLILASFAARVVGLVIFSAKVWQSVLHGCKPVFDRIEAKSMLSFGGWITVSSLIGPLMYIADRFVIGAVLGAVAITIYTVPFSLAQRTMILPTALSNVLFPKLTAEPDLEKSRALSEQASIFVGQSFAVIMLFLICMMTPALQLWLGKAFHMESALIGKIALAGWWINGVANFPFNLIQAKGNPRFTALLHLAELAPYFLILFILSYYFGLAGVVTAFALRCLIDCLILAKRGHGHVRRLIATLALPATLIVVAILLSPYMINWTGALICAFGFAIIGAINAYLNMPAPIKKRVIQLLPDRVIR